MGRTALVLACVVLITVAGSATTAQPAPHQPSATKPLSPVIQTGITQENGVGTSDYPPGTSADGIENATHLVQAHRSTLSNISYKERSVWGDLTTVNMNGTPRVPEVRQYTVTVENGTNGTAVHISGENESNGYWFTDEATMTKVGNQQYGPEALYEYSRGDREYTERLSFISEFGSSGLEPYLRDLDYEFVGTVPRENRTLYVYSSTGINETVQPNIGDTPLRSTTESITATVVISDRGIVEGFSAEETHSVENETITLNHSFWVTDVGETVTEPPRWVTEEIAQFNASFTGNGSVLALTHLGGPTLSSPGVFLNTPTEYGQARFNGTIEAGETVYLYLTVAEESNETQFRSTREPPSVNDSFVSLAPGNVSVLTARYLFLDNEPIESIEVAIERSTQLPAHRGQTNSTTGTDAFDAARVPNPEWC